MSWIYLVIAGILEVAWAATMKSTEGFTRLVPSLVTVTLMVASFYLLGIAMRDLPTSTSYAVWVGIGAVGTALVVTPRGCSCSTRPTVRSSGRGISCLGAPRYGPLRSIDGKIYATDGSPTFFSSGWTCPSEVRAPASLDVRDHSLRKTPPLGRRGDF